MKVDHFESEIAKAIKTAGDFDRERPMIVALSGGADSTALLTAMVSLGYRCLAAHCNFHLRGPESDRDYMHAKATAAALSCEFVSIDFDVRAFMNAHPGNSVETACRVLRYDWFDRLAEEQDAAAIAVGHNSGDDVETLLFNLFRGTGIAGIRGMRPLNDKRIIRPMLGIGRDEITDYLSRKGIGYITDSTNLENNFSRNKIRNEILPLIESLFPDARKGISSSIRQLAENETFYRQCVAEKQAIYTAADGAIDVRALKAGEPSAALLLYEWLKPLGLSRTQAGNIIDCAGDSGKTFLTSSGAFLLNRGILTLRTDCRPLPDVEELFEITHHTISEFAPERNPDIAYFDDRVLKGEPLTVRRWHEGDRMKPFGMKGSKKLSDIFNDAKISVAHKQDIPLLVKGDSVLWLCGVRASDLFKVTERSTGYITIRYRGY